jgi:hypothetical protein
MVAMRPTYQSESNRFITGAHAAPSAGISIHRELPAGRPVGRQRDAELLSISRYNQRRSQFSHLSHRAVGRKP